MSDAEYRHFFIGAEDAGREVRSFLTGEMGLSGRALRSIKFSEDGLFLNGARVTVRRKVAEGDHLSVRISDRADREEGLEPVSMPLEIFYEDEALLVVSKPAGIVCHPSRGHFSDSLANGIRAYLNDSSPASRVHLLGRLDKDTSGLVSIAKNRILAEQFQNGRPEYRAEKLYLALISGHVPPQGKISLTVEEKRDSQGILRLVPGENGSGKETETEYRILRQCPDFSLAAVRIRTGRMHQIRFHFAQLGHPLFGDSLYGNGPVPGLSRSALHAAALKLTRPEKDAPVLLFSPLPADMTGLLHNAGLSAEGIREQLFSLYEERSFPNV